ncbi:(R,S)-reticuline 7-O-methyltransferase [Spatholobus suberectus]|nr:(R,S)-reticuline 7-O-methyltransferase [Spatholobus suberectus]
MGEIQRAVWYREEEAEARVDIWKYIFGFVEVTMVKCAIELGIADAIESHRSTMTISEMSSTLECDPSLLNHIMRILIHQKIFKSVSTSHGYPGYAQTPLSRRFRPAKGKRCKWKNNNTESDIECFDCRRKRIHIPQRM